MVVDTRHSKEETLRKRVCPHCGNTVYTCEFMDDTGYAEKVIKKIHSDNHKNITGSKRHSTGG